jgi:hypothetical protein
VISVFARCDNIRPLKARDGLPEVEAAANLAWREGWWQGIVIGFVTGLAVAAACLVHS